MIAGDLKVVVWKTKRLWLMAAGRQKLTCGIEGETFVAYYHLPSPVRSIHYTSKLQKNLKSIMQHALMYREDQNIGFKFVDLVTGWWEA